MNTLRTCLNCGWVHMGVTRVFAEAAVKEFNEWYDSAPEGSRESFGVHASMSQYEHCFRCGEPWIMTRVYREGDLMGVHTVQPILMPDEAA